MLYLNYKSTVIKGVPMLGNVRFATAKKARLLTQDLLTKVNASDAAENVSAARSASQHMR